MQTQMSAWGPFDFGTARMAALGWLLRMANWALSHNVRRQRKRFDKNDRPANSLRRLLPQRRHFGQMDNFFRRIQRHLPCIMEPIQDQSSIDR